MFGIEESPIQYFLIIFLFSSQGDLLGQQGGISSLRFDRNSFFARTLCQLIMTRTTMGSKITRVYQLWDLVETIGFYSSF